MVFMLRYDRLESAGKATVIVLKVTMLIEYGYIANKQGVGILRKAINENSGYWEWNLYCGRVLSRISRADKCKDVAPGQEQVGSMLGTHV
jgi:hypothetical protein